MATFSKTTFSYASYASFRPTYPQSLYDAIFSFHSGLKACLLDVATGHGLVARSLAPFFDHVMATDLSDGMLSQARSLTPLSTHSNITFRISKAESMPWLADSSVDIVTAAQAAHWFDQPPFFREMRRVLRPEGTLAMWGYGDPELVDFPSAAKVLQHYISSMEQGELGRYWLQPGASIIKNLLRDVTPPAEEWAVKRTECVPEPSFSGTKSSDNRVIMQKRMTLEHFKAFLRTFSAYHGWKEDPQNKSQNQKVQGEDMVDEILTEMRNVEGEWRSWGEGWLQKDVNVECGTGLILAKRR